MLAIDLNRILNGRLASSVHATCVLPDNFIADYKQDLSFHNHLNKICHLNNYEVIHSVQLNYYHILLDFIILCLFVTKVYTCNLK